MTAAHDARIDAQHATGGLEGSLSAAPPCLPRLVKTLIFASSGRPRAPSRCESASAILRRHRETPLPTALNPRSAQRHRETRAPPGPRWKASLPTPPICRWDTDPSVTRRQTDASAVRRASESPRLRPLPILAPARARGLSFSFAFSATLTDLEPEKWFLARTLRALSSFRSGAPSSLSLSLAPPDSASSLPPPSSHSPPGSLRSRSSPTHSIGT